MRFTIVYILLAIYIASAICTQAKATPYFRLLDPAHPQVSAGVWSDPVHASPPVFGSAVAIITHKAGEGGAVIQSIQSDWSPLSIGGGYGGGEAFIAMGASANLSPVVKAFMLRGLDLVAAGKYANVRQLLAPKPGDGPDINIAFGPQFLFMPIEAGNAVPVNRWRGRFVLFAGAAWEF